MTLTMEIPEPEPFRYILIHYSAAPLAGGKDYAQRHFCLETGENPVIAEMLRMLHSAAGTPGGLPAGWT